MYEPVLFRVPDNAVAKYETGRGSVSVWNGAQVAGGPYAVCDIE
jgi:hypothetical protein